MARINAIAMIAALLALSTTAHALEGADHFATCSEAMAAKPNYSYTQAALQQCPDLLAYQADPTLEKTFFVPSNDAIQKIADYIGVPVPVVIKLKGIMCQFLRYHIVSGKQMPDSFTVGQTFNTALSNAKLTVVASGDAPQLKTKMGGTSTVERITTCGASVAYGISDVLAPFPLPKLG